jgi:hypothetical protein
MSLVRTLRIKAESIFSGASIDATALVLVSGVSVLRFVEKHVGWDT